MPPPLLFDISTIDLTKVIVDREAVYAALPQRHEFAMLDGLVHADVESRQFVGFKDICNDDWWARGHIPGRPLFPGVLMIEVGAQLVSYMAFMAFQDRRFFGFGGVDNVKFRQAVTPPSRLYILGEGIESRPRRMVCAVQAIVDGVQVFEARITGMPL